MCQLLLKHSCDGGVVGFVYDEILFQAALLHVLLSPMNLGYAQLNLHMSFSNFLSQSPAKKLHSIQSRIDLLQLVLECGKGVGCLLPGHFDFGGKFLDLLLLDGALIKIDVFISDTTHFALGSDVPLPAGAINGGNCDI